MRIPNVFAKGLYLNVTASSLSQHSPDWVRLFYSKPYLTRLEELTREVSLGFTFPNGGGTRGEVGHNKMMKMLEDVVRMCGLHCTGTGMSP